MAVLGLIFTATKLAGVLVTITLAANALSFSRYRRKNLRSIRPLIDESSETLAVFDVDAEVEENRFFFGLATAPAHVEDNLNDAWLQFAEERPCRKAESSQSLRQTDALMASVSSDGDQGITSRNGEQRRKMKPLKISMEAMIRGFRKYSEQYEEEEDRDEEEKVGCEHNVASWHSVPNAEERLRFWSNPDTELKLAKDAGVSVFRMGIDWTRVMPAEPKNGKKETVDWAALERYRWIIQRVHSHGMKVMLTLFHHSLPPWAGDYGGWKMEKTVDYFMEFTRYKVQKLCMRDMFILMTGLYACKGTVRSLGFKAMHGMFCVVST
ncbi:unnamed protein product [Victoria cruziana]